MEYIEEILSKGSKDNKIDIVGIIISGIMFFTTIPIIVIFFNGSDLLVLMFFLGLFLMPIIGYIMGTKLGKLLIKPKRVNFNKTKLYKKLEKKGYLREFIDTINREIDKENTIKYYNEGNGVGLLITETWFVVLDTMYPEFVKVSEIIKISEELYYKSSQHFMCLELKNNEYIHIRRYLSCDEIKDEIKIKYPNIQIGTSIIDK